MHLDGTDKDNMIYWFIGQPGTGKSTLAKLAKITLQQYHSKNVVHFDGDDLRTMFGGLYKPENFTKEYRKEQTRQLQKLLAHIDKQGVDIVVSTVNPYRDIREDFKKSHIQIIEIYITKSDERGREAFNASDFEPPWENFIHIDTTGKTPEQSINELWEKL